MRRILLLSLVAVLVLWCGRASAKKWAAVLIDMQPGFSSYGKQRGLSDAQCARVRKPQALILRALAAKGVPVAVVEYAGSWGSTDPGLLAAIGNAPHAIVKKSADDAFSSRDLNDVLQKWGATDLVLMGANLKYCVLSTVRGAARQGCYKLHVPWSAVEEYNLGSRAEIVREAQQCRPEYDRLATVYERANALLRQIPDQHPPSSVQSAAQSLAR